MGTKSYQKLNNFFSLSYNQNRIFGLDLLRAISIMMVMLLHGQWFLSTEIRSIQKYFLIDGVGIFFVLSGFLVGGILINTLKDNKSLSFKLLLSFWVKRWLRTLPVYYLCLSFLIILSSLFRQNFDWKEGIIYIFFLQNFSSELPKLYVESWSLCVEEWFYFLVPLLLLFISLVVKKTSKQIILITILFLILANILLKFIIYYQITDKNSYLGIISHHVPIRIGDILFGFLGAWFANYYHFSWSKYKNQLFLLSIFWIIIDNFYLVIYSASINNFYLAFTFIIFPIKILLLLPYLSNWKESKGYLSKVITYISLLSYALYLTHLTFIKDWLVMPKIKNYYDIPFIPYFLEAFILYWVGSYVISFIIYKYYEYPIIEWRNKKFA